VRTELGAKHALLLQGPVGPFFRFLADELRAGGAEVTKVNFNAGDALFYRGSDAVPFRGSAEEWPQFLADLLETRAIDAVFLFGDCRSHHEQAIQIAAERDIPVWVLEEGYLRPDYVTLEPGGANGHSTLPKDPGFYRSATAGLDELPPPTPVGNSFPHHAAYTSLHAWAVTLFSWRYPHYRHHRSLNAVTEGLYWARGFTRKLWYASREKALIDKVRGEWEGRYFFVPLQVHCDAQIQHARFQGMEAFMEEVVASFAEHAPTDCLLVLKHHPHDRAYREYGDYLRELGERYGCSDRLVYVHDLHLPTLLKKARGTITMNSTVGISSLHHKTPVKVLGDAVYDVPELTFQGELSEFFADPGAVDDELFASYCRCLREINQINGNFYKSAASAARQTYLRLQNQKASPRAGLRAWKTR